MTKKREPRVTTRNKENRSESQKILIVCEGEKTEPNYFRGWVDRICNANLYIDGDGYNTDSLVENYVPKVIEKLERQGIVDFDEIWVVFDKDSFSDDNFNRAIQLAENNGYKVAVSNQAFELWYILHYCFLDTCIDRNQYNKMLTQRLGFQYQKNNTEMYQILEKKQKTAIRNAKKLFDRFTEETSHAQRCPYTTVFQLVERLNDPNSHN